MASPSAMTVTVDRISNGGNAIAQEQVNGKTIHAPASAEVGDTLEVRLTKQSGYFKARLVDRTEQTQPRQPSVSPDTSDIGQDLVNPDRNNSHSYSISKSVTKGTFGQELRSWVSSRKM